MYRLLETTAWQMEKPAAYGTFHLLFLIVGLSACVALAYAFRKTTEKQNKMLLFSVGLILFVGEVYKQLFYTFYIGGGEYQWWIFPFQLCSIPMYFCLALPFIKNDTTQRALYAFLASYNLLGGFVSLFEPSGLCHEYVTLTLHAFLWHLLLVFVGLYLIASKRVDGSLREFKLAFIVFLVLACIAQGINILFREQGIKMFYISPYHSTPILVFKDIEATFGWFVNMIVYLFALTLGGFVFNRVRYFWAKFEPTRRSTCAVEKTCRNTMR